MIVNQLGNYKALMQLILCFNHNGLILIRHRGFADRWFSRQKVMNSSGHLFV